MSDTQKSAAKLPFAFVLVLAVILAGGYWFLNRDTASGNGPGQLAADQCRTSLAAAGAAGPFAKGDLAAFAVTDEARRMPALSFKDGGDVQRGMAEFGGRTILLNLWATWCAPCREEMPWLQTLHRELGGDEFSVVPVSVDMGGADKPKAFYDEIGLVDLPFYHDGTMGVFNELKKQGFAFGLPATVMIGPDGCLIGAMNGPAHWASDDAKALVGAALAAIRAGSQ